MEYAEQEPEAKDISTKCCVQPPGASTPGRGELYDVAVSFFKEHGMPPHPSVLMRQRGIKRGIEDIKPSGSQSEPPEKRKRKCIAAASAAAAAASAIASTDVS